ncbi:MAG: hypothetical protein Q8O30_02170 [Candidatus Omnitrophota bacterium]|nr:hypothetical protein [Candidatus Omnitrophota bacterium]
MKVKDTIHRIFKPLLFTIFLLLLSACAKSDANKEKEIVAYVNKEPIYALELQREIARKVKSDPTFKLTPQAQSDQLENIINRKLIVQAAMRKGLAQEERFVNTIKAFWEQALIRDFIDYKNKQAQDYLFVTEDDINKYYDNLSKKVTFKVLKAKDKRAAEDAYKKYLKDKDTSMWQTIGPLGYEEIESTMLLDAFRIPIDEVKKIDDIDSCYLMTVVAKESVAIEPLEKIKPEIEKRVIISKERRLFEDWLSQERKKAKIEINKDSLY